MNALTPTEREWLTEAVASINAALARRAPLADYRFPDDDRRADIVHAIAEYIIAARIA